VTRFSGFFSGNPLKRVTTNEALAEEFERGK
jgi:hypothetical protein